MRIDSDIDRQIYYDRCYECYQNARFCQSCGKNITILDNIYHGRCFECHQAHNIQTIYTTQRTSRTERYSTRDKRWHKFWLFLICTFSIILVVNFSPTMMYGFMLLVMFFIAISILFLYYRYKKKHQVKV